jgi:hypothetical protein
MPEKLKRNDPRLPLQAASPSMAGYNSWQITLSTWDFEKNGMKRRDETVLCNAASP